MSALRYAIVAIMKSEFLLMVGGKPMHGALFRRLCKLSLNEDEEIELNRFQYSGCPRKLACDSAARGAATRCLDKKMPRYIFY